MLFLSMFVLGGLIGFVGAGGAGVTIALLTSCFGIPIHTALGTSLAGMMFTTLSGSISHFREGNILWRIGVAIGAFGAAGAWLGASISSEIDGARLAPVTGVVLLLSSFLFYLKMFRPQSRLFRIRISSASAGRYWFMVGLTGCCVGFISGLFGVGAAPFIQIALLILFHVPLTQTVGTTMLIILPVAALGGLGYLWHGHLDFWLFLQVLSGQMTGAYIGAKFTRLAPELLLRCCVVCTPALGGIILILQ